MREMNSLQARLIRAALILGTSLVPVALPAAAQPVVVGFERFGSEDNTGVSSGLLLYNELSCSACHGMATAQQSAFPKRMAPKLEGVGERVRFDYLRAFIAAPHAVKPGTTMPAVFAGKPDAEVEAASDALAHFLLSLGGSFASDTETPNAERLARGEALFHSVGCVACHEPTKAPNTGHSDDPFWEADSVVETPDREVPSVPFPDFAQKTSAAALARFLADPLHVRPGGRMPNLQLAEEEAAAIAAWLVYRNEATPPTSEVSYDPAKAEAGRALFQTVGCASCHEIDGTNSVLAASALTAERLGAGGCIAPEATGKQPWFALSDNQRAALRTLFAEAPATETPTAEDRINHTALALNCYACHERNGLGGPEAGRAPYFTETEALDLGDEGRMPPTLTGVGSKLTPEWLHDILTDGGRVRPYMATRMPHFGEANVAPLAEALLAVDKVETPLSVDVTGLLPHHRSHYGRELMGTNGLGCVTCHNLNGTKSLGIPAVDLAFVPERLNPEWFLRYMLDPASLRPGTRMPAFFIDGKSQGSKLFSGHAQQQIEALWVYLREVKEIRLPEGMEDGADYELKPTTRPIIHRTFIENVGTYAIAVGFPEGIHFAYDARTMRPAVVWRGRFIDAESAQADRFTPFVKPLGESVVSLPTGASLAPEASGPWTADALRFTGYRLDDARVPIFQYQRGALRIEESLRPAEDGKSLRRKWVLSGPPQTQWVRIGVGEKENDMVFRIGELTIQVATETLVETGPEDVGWIMPVTVTEAGTSIEQVISW